VILRLFAAGLLACGFFSIGQNGTSHAVAAGSASSITPVRSYTNADIGFTYLLPDGFSLNKDAPKQLGVDPAMTLFVADQAVPDRSCVNRILVMADDTRKYRAPMPTRTFAANLAAGLTKNPEVTLIRTVYESRVAHRRAYRADFTKKLGCGLLYQSLVVIKVRSFDLCWMLGGFSQQERDHLLESLQSISFVG
jgi:hypothetical protein